MRISCFWLSQTSLRANKTCHSFHYFLFCVIEKGYHCVAQATLKLLILLC